MFGRIGEVTDAIVHLKPTRPAFYIILGNIRHFVFWLFLDLGNVGDNRLLKSIIDHRNQRHSTIDNRLSAIIATSLVKVTRSNIMVPCGRFYKSQGIHICNIKAISLLVRKLWQRLKFFKSRSNFKVKVTRSKFMVPSERSCHKQYTCAIWKLYLLRQESSGQGQSFCSRIQRRRGHQGYDISSPDIRPGSLKIGYLIIFY